MENNLNNLKGYPHPQKRIIRKERPLILQTIFNRNNKCQNTMLFGRNNCQIGILYSPTLTLKEAKLQAFPPQPKQD